MDHMVNEYVDNCEMCTRNKARNRKPAGLLQPLPIPGRPWESIGMDFITHLPKTNAGNTALYVVIDRLTKLTHIVPYGGQRNSSRSGRYVHQCCGEASWTAKGDHK